MDNEAKFKKFIDEIRDEIFDISKNASIGKLAKEAGIHKGTIYNFLNGSSKDIMLGNLWKIVNALDMDMTVAFTSRPTIEIYSD